MPIKRFFFSKLPPKSSEKTPPKKQPDKQGNRNYMLFWKSSQPGLLLKSLLVTHTHNLFNSSLFCDSTDCSSFQQGDYYFGSSYNLQDKNIIFQWKGYATNRFCATDLDFKDLHQVNWGSMVRECLSSTFREVKGKILKVHIYIHTQPVKTTICCSGWAHKKDEPPHPTRTHTHSF